MPQKALSSWYNWTDMKVLESLLRRCCHPDSIVVEVASGPNIAVPHALERIGSPFSYVSLDIERMHLSLQRKGTGSATVQGVVGDAVHLPLRKGCADLIVFHHAIDDVLETRGFEGVKASVQEALRALKTGGSMVFSHCVFTYDRYTCNIDLDSIQIFLQSKIDGRFQMVDGSNQRWLLVEDIHVRSQV